MDSVSKARQRFRHYPVIFGKCGKEASSYATCVLKQDNLTINNCVQEFESFKNCLQKVALTLKTRI